MNVPFVRKLELNLSGRYDGYNDFGSTTNPKFALNWQINDSLKVRGNSHGRSSPRRCPP